MPRTAIVSEIPADSHWLTLQPKVATANLNIEILPDPANEKAGGVP